MKIKILLAISIAVFLALAAGCIEDKPVIEQTTAKKKGSLLVIEAWITNKEWGSFVEVTVEAVEKETGQVSSRQVTEHFIKKDETRHLTLELSIDRGKEYYHRVEARYK